MHPANSSVGRLSWPADRSVSCDVAATGRTCDFAQGMEVEQVMKPRVSLGSLDKERWLKKYLNYVCILNSKIISFLNAWEKMIQCDVCNILQMGYCKTTTLGGKMQDGCHETRIIYSYDISPIGSMRLWCCLAVDLLIKTSHSCIEFWGFWKASFKVDPSWVRTTSWSLNLYRKKRKRFVSSTQWPTLQKQQINSCWTSEIWCFRDFPRRLKNKEFESRSRVWRSNQVGFYKVWQIISRFTRIWDLFPIFQVCFRLPRYIWYETRNLKDSAVSPNDMV